MVTRTNAQGQMTWAIYLIYLWSNSCITVIWNIPIQNSFGDILRDDSVHWLHSVCRWKCNRMDSSFRSLHRSYSSRKPSIPIQVWRIVFIMHNHHPEKINLVNWNTAGFFFLPIVPFRSKGLTDTFDITVRQESIDRGINSTRRLNEWEYSMSARNSIWNFEVFTVIPPSDLNFIPNTTLPLQVSQTKETGVLFFKNGKISMTVRIIIHPCK